MRAINRLLEVSLYNKYQKYIKNDLVPEIEKFLGTHFSILPSSYNPYGIVYRSMFRLDNKSVDVVLSFTTNDYRIEGDDKLLVDLIVNGKSFPSTIKAKNVGEDIGSLSYAFDSASRYFDVNLSLEDDKLEED